jgi:polyisoprenoid-binding protein YceI
MVTMPTSQLNGARVRWLGVVALGVIGSAGAEPARYDIDPEHLTVAFLVEHIGYARVLGQFLKAGGGYTFDEATGELSAVRVVVETASVATHHEARDEHLKSDDFLGTASNPTMTFTAHGARRTGERTFEVSGELELKGTRRPLVLEATWNKSAPYPIGERAQVMGVSLRGTLLRSEFGMTYGIANGLVGDEVEILIELEARRAGGGAQR